MKGLKLSKEIGIRKGKCGTVQKKLKKHPISLARLKLLLQYCVGGVDAQEIEEVVVFTVGDQQEPRVRFRMHIQDGHESVPAASMAHKIVGLQVVKAQAHPGALVGAFLQSPSSTAAQSVTAPDHKRDF